MVLEAQRVEEEVDRWNTPAIASRARPPGGDAGEVAELARELVRVEERVAALRGILAATGESEAVLHSLGAAAAAAEVRFLRFAPEPEYQLDGYLASAVSVVAEGAFADFLRFFEGVSLSPHLVLMEEVALERAPGDLLQCRLTAVTVRPGEDGGLEAQDPPTPALGSPER